MFFDWSRLQLSDLSHSFRLAQPEALVHKIRTFFKPLRQ